MICFICLIGTPAHNAGDDFTPPELDQPAEFSNVVGNYKSLTVTVTPKEVFVGEPILLRVDIIGKGMKRYAPKRRYLKLFPPEVKTNFHIEPLPQKDRYDAEKGMWTFFYQLKPKRAGISQLPSLHLWYYHRDEVFQGYQPLFSAAIPLVVKRRPKIIAAPKRLYQIAIGPSVLRRADESSFPWLLLALGLVVPPVGCFVWFWLWRALYPDDAARVKRRRSRAARQALKALARADGRLNAAQTADVMTGYLHDRLGLKISAPTPNEIEACLQRCGIPSVPCSKAAELYQTCNQAIFAPPPRGAPQDLRRVAMELIETIEDEAT